MAEAMGRLKAVRQLFNDCKPAATVSEFMAFWKACSEAEKTEFAQSAAKQLGLELTEAA